MTTMQTEQGFRKEIGTISFENWWEDWKNKPADATARDKEIARSAWIAGWMMSGVISRREAREAEKINKKINAGIAQRRASAS